MKTSFGLRVLLCALTILVFLPFAEARSTHTSAASLPPELSPYVGKVVLVVNTASRCGFTPQYEGLEALYRKWKSMGFVVLGFPSNDFGFQEPGSNEEIKKFCIKNYQVSFPLFPKSTVFGKDKTPLYRYLTTNAQPAGEVSWNFEKFLVGKNGKVLARFGSRVKPESPEIEKAIRTALIESQP